MELNQRLNAAWQSLQKGDVTSASLMAVQMVESHPKSVDARQLLGLCHAQQGNDAAAEAAFQTALQLSPNHPQVLANLATVLRRNNRLNEAVLLWQRAVTAAPDFSQAWIDLGLSELNLGHAEQAAAALQQAVRRQPQSALAWHGLGNALKAKGNLDESEAAFKKAVALKPDYGSAWLNLGAVQRLLGHADEALQSFGKARQCGFDSPLLAEAEVGALLDNGQINLALQQARQLVARHPDFVSGHDTLANLQWEYRASCAPGEEPLHEFKASAFKQPKNRELQLAYAAFLLKARQGVAALEHIEAHIENNQQPDVLRLHADALELLGEQEKASKIYARTYQLLGNRDAGFMNAYTRHLLKAGHLEDASKIAWQAIQTDSINQEAWAYLSTIWRLQGDSREYWLCDYERFISLQEVELPSGYTDMTMFLQELREALEHLHAASHAPVQQSLREGSQTPGRLFGRKIAVIQAVQQALQQSVETWISQLPADPRHPFLGRNSRRIRFSGSWSVKLWSSGNHVNHIHPEGWMSSAFYVALPASVVSTENPDTSGYIQFGQPLEELNLDLPPRRIIKPELGKLALFPSYMWHGTVPFVDEEPRISIAFDMQPKA